jgi:lysozyme family protein
MNGNFDNALSLVLKEEGGFSNHPKDPGGMTNLGVTKTTWEAFVGHPVDEATMRALTRDDVAPLYQQNYWDAVRGDDLPAGVDYAVMDYAVNSGVRRAARALQSACGATPDGHIGDQTIAAVNHADATTLVDNVCDSRLAFLQSLPTFATFGNGWSARVARVKAGAEQMVPPAGASAGAGAGGGDN